MSFFLVLSGGPLGSQKYNLWNIHLHWGSGYGWGSCHTLNGKSFSGELHMATWNKDRYESVLEATKHPDGIAILAFWLDIGSEDNYDFTDVIANLNKIRHNGETLMGLQPIHLEKFLPEHIMPCMWT